MRGEKLETLIAYMKLVKAVNSCSEEVREEVRGELEALGLDDSLQV